jgi:hypothetical protein
VKGNESVFAKYESNALAATAIAYVTADGKVIEASKIKKSSKVRFQPVSLP